VVPPPSGYSYSDIQVSHNCNANKNNCTHFGTNYPDSGYAHDTAEENVFMGANKFTVKEIEVFQIAD
jgi:hypothetical protein